MKAILYAGAVLLSFSTVHAVDVEQPEVRTFIDEMVRDHEFDRAELVGTLKQAERKQAILDAISRPAEKTLSWAEYRRIFITPERIEAGADFCRENGDMLAEVAATSGVPEEILVGIIGVETYYGRITGGYRVLDALSTLAFYYPPRAQFFRKELKQYLLLVREEEMPADQATGSYAGAMGLPQFMPSSFRMYAIDSTADGKRDIWNNWTDVAASIANYFNAHGWRSNQPVIAQASLGKRWHGEVPKPENTLTPQDTVRTLSDKGVLFATDLPDDSKTQLLTYEGKDGTEHWVGFHNFFVITRYNRSVMYALAVHQLGQEIAYALESDAS
ncbi:MAG: lytic murein transglycosylase B [Gammaproteobacteria bacterium]|nr:lytic murein transglycosylase B [Gammaproteobacteria bacterium]